MASNCAGSSKPRPPHALLGGRLRPFGLLGCICLLLCAQCQEASGTLRHLLPLESWTSRHLATACERQTSKACEAIGAWKCSSTTRDSILGCFLCLCKKAGGWWRRSVVERGLWDAGEKTAGTDCCCLGCRNRRQKIGGLELAPLCVLRTVLDTCFKRIHGSRSEVHVARQRIQRQGLRCECFWCSILGCAC